MGKLTEYLNNFEKMHLMEDTLGSRTWYHGTTADFDKFSNRFTAGQLGIHLGTEDQARFIIDDVGYLLEVKIGPAVKRLIRLKDEGSWYGESFVAQLKANPKTSAGSWRGSMSDRDIARDLIDMGYGGAIYMNRFEGDQRSPSIIIFDANNLTITGKTKLD